MEENTDTAKPKSKYENANYRPTDLEDSIHWHEYIFVGLKAKADAAEAALRKYQSKLVNDEMTKRASDKRATLEDYAQFANLVFLPEDDETLGRLQMACNNAVSDKVNMENKIQRLRNLMQLQGNVKL